MDGLTRDAGRAGLMEVKHFFGKRFVDEVADFAEILLGVFDEIFVAEGVDMVGVLRCVVKPVFNEVAPLFCCDVGGVRAEGEGQQGRGYVASVADDMDDFGVGKEFHDGWHAAAEGGHLVAPPGLIALLCEIGVYGFDDACIGGGS